MTIIFLLGFVGIILIFLEFFLPGAVLAVIGTLLLLVSLGLFFAEYPVFWGILYMVGMLLTVYCTCRYALFRLKQSQKKGNFTHGEDQAGYQASFFVQTLIGKEGNVSTELKPAGHIVVEGKLYHALSETGFISKNEAVQIVGGKGSHLIVRKRI